jgi:hypothetical protein
MKKHTRSPEAAKRNAARNKRVQKERGKLGLRKYDGKPLLQPTLMSCQSPYCTNTWVPKPKKNNQRSHFKLQKYCSSTCSRQAKTQYHRVLKADHYTKERACKAPDCNNTFVIAPQVKEEHQKFDPRTDVNRMAIPWNKLYCCSACGQRTNQRKRAESVNAAARKRYYHKKKTDPAYVIRLRLSDRVRKALRRAVDGIIPNKLGTTWQLLGCSHKEFMDYFKAKFTRGMSWKRLCLGEIHIDHIRPCSSFDLTKESEQKKCFHFSNLQPLWAFDNISKGSKYEGGGVA